MRHALSVVVRVAALCVAATSACASVQVIDDTGAAVVLAAPARRIVSLAPHTTELLFAAGAGGYVVGAVDYSDYPAAAKAIPRVGSSSLLDMEAIAALKPDLVVVWRNGTSAARIDALRALGIPVYLNEPRTLAGIASTLERLGELAGTGPDARAAAQTFAARLAALRERYAGRRPVPVFWQIWATPLLTINGHHVISDAIRLCGGVNVFAELGPLVPAITPEAVVAADPEAIVTTGSDATATHDDGLALWRALPRLRATARGNLIVLDADAIHRQSARVLDGVDALCARLDGVRSRAAASR